MSHLGQWRVLLVTDPDITSLIYLAAHKPWENQRNLRGLIRHCLKIGLIRQTQPNLSSTTQLPNDIEV